jgi:hypothetical protein
LVCLWVRLKLIFKENTSTGDYHREMNGKIFTKWLNEKLIPNLPLHSVVVIDNAPYHTIYDNKCPTKSSTKSVITSWLQRHNIQFRQNMHKAELFDLCQKHKPAEPIYGTDLILRHKDMSVLGFHLTMLTSTQSN